MTLVVDGQWGSATTSAFQQSLNITVDGVLGPNTWKAFQSAVGITVDGVDGPQTYKALQMNVGATVDGILGPETIKKLQEHLNAGKGWVKVTIPSAPTSSASEAEATPNIITPTATDFPAWIRYEEKLDQQLLSSSQWNLNLEKHYGKPYNPIELHTHWWGNPGEAGTHDGNVDYLNRTADVSANYVVSAGRVTLTVPLNKIALTTGQRNPFAWKCECDPLITTSTSDLGYRTIGFLAYLVEKLNPSLVGEAIRLHKEFYATSCSNIDTARVREYAEKFRTGALDPATGTPPVVVEPEPEDVTLTRVAYDQIRTALTSALEALDGAS